MKTKIMTVECSKQLQNLIHEIKNQPLVDNSILVDIVESNKLSEKDIAPFVSYNHGNNESYGRKLIYDNGNFKILLMSWKCGDFTAIHNHGYTEWGSVYFFGDATHRLYKVDKDELELVQKDNFQKGQIAPVSGDLTHMMGNSSDENFTTLHIYGSNTRNNEVSADAKVYVPEFQKIRTTLGSAYLNMTKDLVLTEEPLGKINSDVLLDYFQLVKPFYERNNNKTILGKLDHFLSHQNTQENDERFKNFGRKF